jgi:hypothetical protein
VRLPAGVVIIATRRDDILPVVQRSKRNTVDYDGIGVATEADVLELIDEATRLQGTIEDWLRENHPDLA